MTVHLLPCGTSILANLIPPRSVTSLNRDDVDVVTAWANRTLPAGALDRPETWTESFRSEIVPYLDPISHCQHPVRLSAEVASLHHYCDGRPAPADRVVLLASDTAKGMLAALLNAARFRRPVRVHARPVLDGTADGVPILEEGSGEPVHILRIPGLLPDTTATFSAAMRNVAEALVWSALLHRTDRAEFALHLSGGYKATLPYLVSLAEYVKGERPPVRAFCLHEGDPEANPTNELVEIYLRATKTRADMEELAVAETRQLPDSGRLLDFAYEDVQARARLTPLGEGLAAMRPYLTGAV